MRPLNQGGMGCQGSTQGPPLGGQIPPKLTSDRLALGALDKSGNPSTGLGNGKRGHYEKGLLTARISTSPESLKALNPLECLRLGQVLLVFSTLSRISSLENRNLLK